MSVIVKTLTAHDTALASNPNSHLDNVRQLGNMGALPFYCYKTTKAAYARLAAAGQERAIRELRTQEGADHG